MFRCVVAGGCHLSDALASISIAAEGSFHTFVLSIFIICIFLSGCKICTFITHCHTQRLSRIYLPFHILSREEVQNISCGSRTVGHVTHRTKPTKALSLFVNIFKTANMLTISMNTSAPPWRRLQHAAPSLKRHQEL